jgi:hypothetical protein
MAKIPACRAERVGVRVSCSRPFKNMKRIIKYYHDESVERGKKLNLPIYTLVIGKNDHDGLYHFSFTTDDCSDFNRRAMWSQCDPPKDNIISIEVINE